MDWKEKLAQAYDVDPNEAQNTPETEAQEPKATEPEPKHQTIYVELDRKGRKGKSASIISGFECSDEHIKEIAKELKQHCGVGGSSRGGEILIQGDHVQKIMQLLKDKGFKVKRIGG